jgi:hypothetical protein
MRAPEDGYLYIAHGERYLKEAITSAASLKKVDKEAHATLITDAPFAAPVFDRVIVKERTLPEEFAYEYMHKVKHMYSSSPYRRTMFLDTDTYFYRNCRGLFNLLDYWDACLCQDPVDSISSAGGDDGYQPYNTGVFIFLKSEANEVFFNKWLEIYKEQCAQANGKYMPDQPALARAVLESRMRVYAMRNNYNARVQYYIGLVGNVSIVHGRFSDFERLKKKLHPTTQSRGWDPYKQKCYYYRRNIFTRLRLLLGKLLGGNLKAFVRNHVLRKA